MWIEKKLNTDLLVCLQIKALNRDLKEAETLTQDVMRDLHSVKLDISNYAVNTYPNFNP